MAEKKQEKKSLTKGPVLSWKVKEETMKTAQEIYNETLVRGGITTDLLGNVPISGYMVSELGGIQVSLNKFSVQDIERVIAESRGTYIGTWIDKEIVYVDYSVSFTELGKALSFGRRNGQKAIYSLNTKKTIYL